MVLEGTCIGTDCRLYNCTSGFTAWRLISGVRFRYQVTAGHCFGVHTAVTHTLTYVVGDVITNAFYPGTNADAENVLQSAGTNSTKIVTTSSPAHKSDVIGAANPAVGQLYCKSGITTQETCSWAVSSSSAVITVCDATGVCTQMVDQVISSRAGYGVDFGDSGGPVYKYADTGHSTVVGYGIISAKNPAGTTLYFSKIFNALAALNLNSLSTLSSP
jgi:hypothetical protein